MNRIELESTLKSYWINEDDIIALAKESGQNINEIIDNPNSVSSEVVSHLRRLFLKKKKILLVLGEFQKKTLVTSSVVNLSKYKCLVKSLKGNN